LGNYAPVTISVNWFRQVINERKFKELPSVDKRIKKSIKGKRLEAGHNQVAAFKMTARSLECDESEKAFDKSLRQLGKAAKATAKPK
jgi:hypothetical protein